MRPLLRLGLIVLLVGAAADAGAEESDAARLFRQGRELMLDYRFSEACPKLEESQRLEPRAGTLLNLAVCHERIGRIGTAWIELQHALVAAREEGRPDRIAFAERRIEVLTPRVPWLTVSVPQSILVEGMTITLNEVPIERDRWGKELAVDPGLLVLRAISPGHHPFEERLTIREGEHRSVVLSALIAKVATPEPKADTPVPLAKPEPDRADTEERRWWVLECGLFGGYLQISPEYALLVSDQNSIELRAPDGSTESCGGYCSYRVPTTGGAVVGINANVGFQATKQFHIGGRLLVGPRLGGGSFFATGPSAQLQVVGPFWVGTSALLGVASLTEYGTVEPEAGYSLLSPGPFEMEASTGFAAGAALELHLLVLDTPQGSLDIHAMPLAIFSTGNAWMVPIGAAYRYH